MKERLMSGWNFMRVLWLVTGVGIAVQAVTEKNFLMLLPGLYFVFTAVANVGCFAGSCATAYHPGKDARKETATGIKYDEIHSKE